MENYIVLNFYAIINAIIKLTHAVHACSLNVVAQGPL